MDRNAINRILMDSILNNMLKETVLDEIRIKWKVNWYSIFLRIRMAKRIEREQKWAEYS